MTNRPSIEARQRQALADLADVERQLVEGELDAETAATLIRTYRREADAASAELASAPKADATEAVRTRRSPVRVAVGSAILLLGFAAAIFAVTRAVEPRGDGGFVTGGTTNTTVDLSTVSNEEMEAVIAANPDIVPMRLALARRYVEQGSFSDALRHYMTVLEGGPDPEALAYVGWMTYLSGDAGTGAAFVERSLEGRPGYDLALWFLANIRMDGLDDPQGALPLVDALLAMGLPDELVDSVEGLRSRIVDAIGSP